MSNSQVEARTIALYSYVRNAQKCCGQLSITGKPFFTLYFTQTVSMLSNPVSQIVPRRMVIYILLALADMRLHVWWWVVWCEKCAHTILCHCKLKNGSAFSVHAAKARLNSRSTQSIITFIDHVTEMLHLGHFQLILYSRLTMPCCLPRSHKTIIQCI